MEDKKEFDLGGIIFVVSVLLILHAIQKWTGFPVLDWLDGAAKSAFGWAIDAVAWISEKTYYFLKWLL